MGKVKEQGNLLIISADLIRVSDGSQLWGETYNRTLSDVITLQENISKQIAENLRLRVTGDQRKIFEKHPTDNAEAYRLYLKGMYFWRKNTIEDYQKSLDAFQKAIDLDPTYALAYAGLGVYYQGVAFEGLQIPKEAYPRAQAAFRKALELDPELPSAHVGLANIKFYFEWQWQEAEQDLRRYIEKDRNHSPRAFSLFLLAMGRVEEAIKDIRISLNRDPLSRYLNVNLGQYLIVAKRYDEAIEQLMETIETDPNYDAAHFSLASAYERKGMFDEAISEYRKGYLAAGDQEAAQIFETAQGESGYRESIKVIADGTVNALLEMSKEKYISPIIIAKQYAQLDNKEEAFRWLEKAYEERSTQLVFLKTDLNWDNLRSDPRFADLMHRVGLP
jgi:tetratricopeptide (TPR) repeat protein